MVLENQDQPPIGETTWHYQIVRELGGGGMGVVYEAEDLNLRRRVALKFLPDYLAHDAAALQRFEWEARAASALNHPNICTIHEFGRHDGRAFIAMEMMKGLTVKELVRARPVEVDKVLTLGIDIADALDAAHAAGLIHRDIKPANIFVTDRGQAKLLDFGIALHGSHRKGPEHAESTQTIPEHLTSTGVVLGTFAYMSPEQARGDELDARTDLYSFGLVLREMVAGVPPPYSGGTALLDTTVPVKLKELIEKALEHDRDLRYQSASDMRADLLRLRRSGPTANARVPSGQSARSTRMYIGAAALAVSLIGGVWFARTNGSFRGDVPAPAASASSIAVLPFADLSSDGNQEYFSDGLAEEVLAQLGQIRGLRVVARTSSFQFKGTKADLRSIGKTLNVFNILEGSVRREGNRVRITAQLVSTADGFRVWSNRYDRELNDILAVQEDIARSVAGALKLTLLDTKGRAPSSRTINADSYSSALQARYFFSKRSKENLEKASVYHEQALRLDPGNAQAWVGLAEVHHSQADAGYISSDEGYRKARLEVERALTLDENLAVAHAEAGWIRGFHDWDWVGADKSYQRALELEPDNVKAVLGAGVLAHGLGRADEAIALAQRAVNLDPLSVPGYNNLSFHAYYAGRWQEAASALDKALELRPDYPGLHTLFGRIYLAQSQPEKALAAMARESDPTWRLFGLALGHHAAGHTTESEDSTRQLIAQYQETMAYQIAEVFAFRGEIEQAFAWLDRAYVQRDSGMADLKDDPLLRNLYKDARYAEFLRRVGLPGEPSSAPSRR